MNSAAENRLFFQGEANFGDSGAPVFIIRDGAVYPIGVLEGYSYTSSSKYLAVQSISSSFFGVFAHITY